MKNKNQVLLLIIQEIHLTKERHNYTNNQNMHNRQTLNPGNHTVSVRE